jgi:hypothetical protein
VVFLLLNTIGKTGFQENSQGSVRPATACKRYQNISIRKRLALLPDSYMEGQKADSPSSITLYDVSHKRGNQQQDVKQTANKL